MPPVFRRRQVGREVRKSSGRRSVGSLHRNGQPAQYRHATAACLHGDIGLGTARRGDRQAVSLRRHGRVNGVVDCGPRHTDLQRSPPGRSLGSWSETRCSSWHPRSAIHGNQLDALTHVAAERFAELTVHLAFSLVAFLRLLEGRFEAQIHCEAVRQRVANGHIVDHADVVTTTALEGILPGSAARKPWRTHSPRRRLPWSRRGR